jgi:phosphopantothenoylcysteine decarboxylase/phosphopantothenate--cysteine ligase
MRLDRQGRLAEPTRLSRPPKACCGPAGSLLGRRIVVSAGPTYEDIDPVRYLGNRSSGRMGYAIAAEASRRGAHVVLVSGPTKLAAPAGAQLERVRSAAEMARAGESPRQRARRRGDGGRRRRLHAGDGRAPTEESARATPPDVDVDPHAGHPRGARQGPRRRRHAGAVGFAPRAGDPRPRARQKLAAKQVDLIVANDVSRAKTPASTPRPTPRSSSRPTAKSSSRCSSRPSSPRRSGSRRTLLQRSPPSVDRSRDVR